MSFAGHRLGSLQKQLGRIVLNLEANISNCHIFIRGRGHSSVEGKGCGVSALTEDSVIGHDCRFETVNLSSSRTALGPARRQQVRHFLQTLCPTWPTHYKPAADIGRCKTVQNVNWSLHRSGPYCLQEGETRTGSKGCRRAGGRAARVSDVDCQTQSISGCLSYRLLGGPAAVHWRSRGCRGPSRESCVVANL